MERGGPNWNAEVDGRAVSRLWLREGGARRTARLRDRHTMSMTREQREFIVRRLAAFETPDDIVRVFGPRFPGVTCRVEDVLALNPRTNIIDPDLHALFYAERERVMEDPSAAPFAEQRVRLIVLSRQAERYGQNNDLANQRAVMRQIAEELGVVAGKAGKAPASASEGAKGPIVGIDILVIDPKPLPEPVEAGK